MGGIVARLAFLPPPPSYDAEWKEITWIKTQRGQRIPLVYVPWPGSKLTIIFSHANAEDLGLIFHHLKTLSEVLHVNVVGYDYTGYGHASGTPSELDCYADIAAVFAYLMTEKNLLPSQVVLYGRSIGSGPSCELASRVEVGGLILQSAFTSCIRVAYDVKYTAFDAFCNLQKMPKIKCPVFMIHGTRDDVVDFQHAKELFKMSRRPHRPFWVKGAAHNDIEISYFTEYCQRLQEFIWSLDPKWQMKPGTVLSL
ncbi:hypothetical protein GUITHDRAFT_159758 [Guillardia theta CCMP2712]|uniref:Serine aminopeptidase S33 domain-containing protein n=1 Tax=Guillardia theta (strain CCMP2712) TaxID=905079 RepID=L1J6M6_GUITC|nr:hypothetical protein GUITHDRAFT_159758 [Guillardia theta CCMP2712]EKX43977.1 hypothetical protein GUITHDRAFT_159758 [Guillardia theta CCMP2712]|mmetsp:Transcript_10388/g.34652  ORF Transcript_10388/g.34652 Transcript_10388/m.34652 type:complete len:254 (+) Transcript_10388:189-950(+)|eukprot:XP_005830957.1 hypothetical protein GUITHDRAFT_159758 [Guillardia theta CCMP2712]